MKEAAYSCDWCKKKAIGTFGSDWLHFKHILFAKGVYTEERDYQNYKNYGNLTFCSMNCLVSYLHNEIKKMGLKTDELNPSSRVTEHES